MNWKIIKEKYPKAHKYLFDHCKVAIDIDKSRFLYDFFDEQDIYIMMILEWDFDNKKRWDFWIDYVEKRIDSGLYDTRTEAEEQAFLRAFKILEDKLWK